ncbi:MAG: xanthine dehydrogenase family protein molybdopterin-binding subunit [Dehalococcoidia bacterium]
MVVEQKSRTRRYTVVGTKPVRHDGLDKVTGRAKFGADVKLSDLVHGAILCSPYAHARIRSIDTSYAEALPGVLAIITGADMPRTNHGVLNIGEEGAVNAAWASNRVMAGDRALFRGHPVAAVAAGDRNTAIEAAKLISVEYEPMDAVLDIRQATAPGAPLVHPDLVGDHLGEPVTRTNVATHFRQGIGDPATGFAHATAVVEQEFELSTVHQGYIEPQTATAFWDASDRVTVWTSTQGAFGVRSQMSSVLGLRESHIKVVPMEIGGGFGGKIAVYLEPAAAILSRKCGRPVKISMDRATVFESTGPGAAAVIRIRMGVDASGRITAAEADMSYEAGAYPGSPVVAGARCCFAAYDIPNVRVDGYDVLVNKPKTAAYRAPGATQAAFAVESVIDAICRSIGMDPLEFRVLNAARPGGRRSDGPRWGSIGLLEVLNAARSSAHWNAPLEHVDLGCARRGRGVATGFWPNGGRRSTVHINVNADGSVSLIEGSTDIGGTRTSIAMQAAEVLGIPVEDVRPSVADTETSGYTDVTGGSRTTYATGLAAYRAAQIVIREMRFRAARLWGIEKEDIEYVDGTFRASADAVISDTRLRVAQLRGIAPEDIVDADKVFKAVIDAEFTMTFRELAARLEPEGEPVSGVGVVDLPEAGGAFGTHIVDVEVDPQTGKTSILRYTVVQDVGTAVHPLFVEGQMEGGAAQGIGWALNEEYILDDNGRMLNRSFLDYRMPTALDLPNIETVIVEVRNPLHPFGVRGVGEVPIVPPVGAIANALHDALGVRMTQAPMKPSRVLEAMGVIGCSGSGRS